MPTVKRELHTLGHPEDGFKAEEVSCIPMPRSMFLGFVEEQIEAQEKLWERVMPDRDKILDTARTMSHFPISAWVERERGCGCLVGEYLVAADILARRDIYEAGGGAAIESLMRSKYEDDQDGYMVTGLGLEIDNVLVEWTETLQILDLYDTPDWRRFREVIWFTED